MELKHGYQNTDIGFIPADWDAIPIELITTHIGDGLHGTPIYSINGEYFFINGNNINGGGIIIDSETKSVNYSEFIKHKKPLNERSILLSINGTIGNVGFFNEEKILLGKSAAYLNIKPKISKYLIFHILQSNIVKRQFFDGLTGSTIGNLGLSTIRQTKIPLPTNKHEQQYIATALSDIDALIDGLSKLITKKRDIKQATMQQLLTGKTRLPGFSGEWKIKPLEELCSLKSGEGITAERIDNHSVFPCYGGNGLRGYTTTYTHEGNYALIGRQGALCGNVISVSGQFFASEHALVVTPSHKTNIVWLTFVLGRMNLNQYSESSAQPGLSATKLLILDVNCPPTKEEQSTIAQILSDMDNEIAALEKRLEKTRLLKQGMMQELLTGRIRLV